MRDVNQVDLKPEMFVLSLLFPAVLPSHTHALSPPPPGRDTSVAPWGLVGTLPLHPHPGFPSSAAVIMSSINSLGGPWQQEPQG